MTATNLAITLAAADMSVVLVDADLYRPMVSAMFGQAPRGSGLVGALEEPESAWHAAVDAPGHPRLSLLMNSRMEEIPLHLLEERRFKTLLDELGKIADVVVIDSPPLPEVAELLDMAAVVDVVLVCVRLRHTRRGNLNQLREMLARRNVAPTGFVVTTKVPAQSEAYEYEYRSAGPAGRVDLTETKISQ